MQQVALDVGYEQSRIRSVDVGTWNVGCRLPLLRFPHAFGHERVTLLVMLNENPPFRGGFFLPVTY
ncbi:Outer membrane protein X precursor [Serratia fonticola]|uniref:Outer membrane protein X n=1 Tax=Serratia fonticola TaxID=47917 RepID=A0A4U9TCI4_SERFO|nr:Outer membrane protein X precursor [Serratia fonticola]